jgi:predicted secreted protein
MYANIRFHKEGSQKNMMSDEGTRRMEKVLESIRKLGTVKLQKVI